MELTMKDLRQVRALLYRVRERWYDIGIELEIAVEELNIIKTTYNDPADCLLHMLQVWLRSIDPVPTWNILAEALTAEAVHDLGLAEEGRHNEVTNSYHNIL